MKAPRPILLAIVLTLTPAWMPPLTAAVGPCNDSGDDTDNDGLTDWSASEDSNGNHICNDDDGDGDGVANYLDCRDAINDPEIAVGSAPNDSTLDCMQDEDSDNYGDDSVTQTGGLVQGTDCDDARSQDHPGAPEIYDLVDNDCDGLVDGADPVHDPVPIFADGFDLHGTGRWSFDTSVGLFARVDTSFRTFASSNSSNGTVPPASCATGNFSCHAVDGNDMDDLHDWSAFGASPYVQADSGNSGWGKHVDHFTIVYSATSCTAGDLQIDYLPGGSAVWTPVAGSHPCVSGSVKTWLDVPLDLDAWGLSIQNDSASTTFTVYEVQFWTTN